jgi:hypothetical protein
LLLEKIPKFKRCIGILSVPDLKSTITKIIHCLSDVEKFKIIST